MFMYVFFWLGGALATGMFASIRRNRSGFGWFLLALLISPLLAFIFVAILRSRIQRAVEIVDTPITRMSNGKAALMLIGAFVAFFIVPVIIAVAVGITH
jgi:hypothetical protein